MSAAAKTTSRALATLKDPTGRPAAAKPSIMTPGGDHSRGGTGAMPGGGHLGFGVSGSIPADGPAKAARTIGRMGDAIPTAGGDALGGTVRGGQDVGYADQIVTGAGEAISNTTTPSQNGHGPLH